MEERYLVKKVEAPIDWTVEVPGSKSMTNRALLMAALSDGPVELEGILISDDSRYFLACLETLGFEISTEDCRAAVRGCGGRIPKREAEIYVGSAGTAARFLTAMLGLSDGSYVIRASEQMKQRPMKPLFCVLKELGAEIIYLEEEDRLPIRIRGAQRGGAFTEMVKMELDISRSTQFLSALLLVSPMLPAGLHIHITGEKTDGSYIRITRNMMREAGVETLFDGRDYEIGAGAVYRQKKYEIEPDMSAACYFYGAAALTGGRAIVKRVHWDNTQGDLEFLGVLQDMGCTAAESEAGIVVQGPKDGRLHAVCVDMNDFSDQALTLAALAPFADGEVRIFHIAHIRQQECDRIRAIAENLAALGIVCREEPDAVAIVPGSVRAGTIKTCEDHRVAMAFSLIGLRTEGIWIENPDCCRKTFESYFSVLDRLTGK